MTSAELRAMFEKAMAVVDGLKTIEGEAYLSVEVGSGSNRICFFPSEKTKEEATRFGLKHFGKLSKDKSGNLVGTKDGLTLSLFGVLKCEVVGYRTERRPKMIETGDFVETQVPIYECRTPIAREVVELVEQN